MYLNKKGGVKTRGKLRFFNRKRLFTRLNSSIRYKNKVVPGYIRIHFSLSFAVNKPPITNLGLSGLKT